LFGASSARAKATAELVYTRAAGVEDCPDEAAFRAAVEARLGYDPFRAEAAQRFRAEVFAADDELVGHLVLVDDAGASSGVRAFRAGACSELAAAMALALSIAINPNLATEASAPAAETETAPPSTPPVAPPAPVSEPTRAKREELRHAEPPASDAPERG